MPQPPTLQDKMTPMRTKLRQDLNKYLASPNDFNFDIVKAGMRSYAYQWEIWQVEESEAESITPNHEI